MFPNVEISKSANGELPRVAEYGQVKANDWPTSERSLMAEMFSPFVRSNVQLAHLSAGYECAGSAMRLTKELWSVRYYSDGAFQGRRFMTEDEARAYFKKLVTKQPS